MSSIRISPKHGVNPMIPKCFFCGEDKNEIALMGLIGGLTNDLEAPRGAVLNYEPCDKCKEHMKLGVTLIAVTDRQPQDNRPAMKAQGDVSVYPLGGWLVIRPEAFSAMTENEWSSGQTCFIDEELFNKLNEQGGQE